MKELPPILEKDWRSTKVRGIMGLSMGGSAMMLAARNPGFYKFAASFSGILQFTSPGMAQAIQFAQNDGGGYDSKKMFGKPSDPAWQEHDPSARCDKLQGTSLCIRRATVSSVRTTNRPTFRCWPPTTPVSASNCSPRHQPAVRHQLAEEGVAARVVYRPSGTHLAVPGSSRCSRPGRRRRRRWAWPVTRSTAPSTATSRRPPPSKEGSRDCLTPDYAVPGGRAQDFFGRIISGPGSPRSWSARSAALLRRRRSWRSSRTAHQ